MPQKKLKLAVIFGQKIDINPLLSLLSPSLAHRRGYLKPNFTVFAAFPIAPGEHPFEIKVFWLFKAHPSGHDIIFLLAWSTNP
jgi:hypothetical protein